MHFLFILYNCIIKAIALTLFSRFLQRLGIFYSDISFWSRESFLCRICTILFPHISNFKFLQDFIKQIGNIHTLRCSPVLLQIYITIFSRVTDVACFGSLDLNSKPLFFKPVFWGTLAYGGQPLGYPHPYFAFSDA